LIAVSVGDRTRDRGCGRRETRTCKTASVALPGGVPFPHVHQVTWITRTRRVRQGLPRTRERVAVDTPVEHVYATRQETAYLICTVLQEYVSTAGLNA
jgi:hypothetical protein